MSIKILDCTLRDGGYVNDWNFTNKEIGHIISSLKDAQIDVVECGYLNDTKGKSVDSTLFASIDVIDTLVASLDVTAQKVVMINFGDYKIEKLPPKQSTQIDGIRLAFHKKDLADALVEASKIIQLGYKLYFQPMITKNYSDLEFLSMIEKVNGLDIYAFYIVDSFGSMTLREFQKYMILADSNLKPAIALGYHSHNNMQLAFSNAINMCNANIKREIIIDSSIYGVGRGAGNLNTELIADYLNTAYEKYYDTLPLLEIIDRLLASLMQKKPWGFSPAQYLSATFNCHPNYATYLINKNANHIVSVKKVLEKIPNEFKSSYKKELIEKLYIEFLLEVKTKVKGYWNISQEKNIVLVASGKSIQESQTVLESQLSNENSLIIALNHKPSFDCDYYFFSNQKRFDEFKEILPLEKIVITSNIFSDLPVTVVLDVNNLVHIEEKIVTNVAVLAINYLVSQNIKEVKIMGLDGYRIKEDNYSYKETSVIVDEKELREQNEILTTALNSLSAKINIIYLTPSIFEKGKI